MKLEGEVRRWGEMRRGGLKIRTPPISSQI